MPDADGVQVRVELAPASLKQALRRLLTDYLDEFAALEGVPPRPRDPDGHASYHWFDQYWSVPARTPLAIWLDDDLAGFCLLRSMDGRWQISEFYVAPPFRRQGVGALAVSAIKQHGRASGIHTMLEASTLAWHDSALAFWQRQGFKTVSRTPERLTNVFHLDT
jgi:predicted acetyltransferase